VNRPASTQLASIGEWAGKALLTAVVVLCFLVALALLGRVQKLFLASQNPPPPLHFGNAARLPSGTTGIQPPWPAFPRNGPRKLNAALVNGVQVVTDEWDCNATPAEVLAYYREQMAARGWHDVTEETYGLQPELREGGYELQDESYVKNYRTVMDANLVLNRGEWSIHVSTQPGSSFGHLTTVKIYAATAPSITQFFEGVGLALMPSDEGRAKTLDAVQQGAGGRYHTTIATRKEPQAQAFQAALAELQAKGWRPLVVLPRQQARPTFSVWLAKGEQYGMLVVNRIPAGSSVAFTEVTPSPGH
jgi:hypothetical protein